jgi:hypothetical protein
VAASVGAVGGGLTFAVGLKALALGAGVAVLGVLPVAAVAATGSYALYRLSYRSALKGAAEEIRRMLEAVGGSVRAAQVFGVSPRPAPPSPRRPGDDGFGLLIS